MKILKALIPYIIAAVFCLVVFFLIGRKVDRISQNFTTALENQNAQFYELTRAEFRDMEKTLSDSLYLKIKDSLNLKIRHIERTIKHEYKHVYDTTITTLIIKENSPYLHFSKNIDSCLFISGHIQDSLIYFDKITVDYEARTVYYWQREHKILGIPFGKKKIYGITLNNCSGESKTVEIEINKK